MTRQRTRCAALAAAGALLFTACGSHPAQRPAPAASVTPSRSDADATFLQLVRAQFAAASSDTALISLGHTICGQLTHGASSAAVIKQLDSALHVELGVQQANVLIGAAEGAYCPQIPADQ